MYSTTPKLRKRPTGGFTLVELLIALAVVGILAAVAVPSISNSTGSHRVVEQTRRIHSDLVEARTRAIAEQRQFRVKFNDGNNAWRIQRDVSGVWTQVDGIRTMPAGLSVKVDGASAGQVVYSPRGRVTAVRSLVVTDDDGHDQRIRVVSSGMVEWFAN